MLEMLSRGLLLAAISISVQAQVSGDPSAALKHALGLTDSQVWQLQQERPRALAIEPTTTPAFRSALKVGDRSASNTASQPTQAEDSLRRRLLDDSQQVKLAVIEEVLHRSDAASGAIVLGLIGAQ